MKRSVSAFALSSWTIFVGFLFIDEIWKLKVEKILKGSLYSIPSPSPSVKIQNMGEKVCLRCKGKTLLGIVKTLLGIVNKLFIFKSLLTTPSNVSPLHLKQIFPPIIWIFTEGGGDMIESWLPFKIFSTLSKNTARVFQKCDLLQKSLLYLKSSMTVYRKSVWIIKIDIATRMVQFRCWNMCTDHLCVVL